MHIATRMMHIAATSACAKKLKTNEEPKNKNENNTIRYTIFKLLRMNHVFAPPSPYPFFKKRRNNSE